jgi:soluble lytic murein transglycosylase-like protein
LCEFLAEVTPTIIQQCILFFSLLNGIDPAVTTAVVATESSGKPLAVGAGKDYGLMQVRAKHVPWTKLQLLQPCTNIMVGTALLAKAKERCVHKLDKTWLVCYNRGMAGARKVRLPKLDKYYLKIVARL